MKNPTSVNVDTKWPAPGWIWIALQKKQQPRPTARLVAAVSGPHGSRDTRGALSGSESGFCGRGRLASGCAGRVTPARTGTRRAEAERLCPRPPRAAPLGWTPTVVPDGWVAVTRGGRHEPREAPPCGVRRQCAWLCLMLATSVLHPAGFHEV